MLIRGKRRYLVVLCFVTAQISIQRSLNVTLATKLLVTRGGFVLRNGE